MNNLSLCYNYIPLKRDLFILCLCICMIPEGVPIVLHLIYISRANPACVAKAADKAYTRLLGRKVKKNLLNKH